MYSTTVNERNSRSIIGCEMRCGARGICCKTETGELFIVTANAPCAKSATALPKASIVGLTLYLSYCILHIVAQQLFDCKILNNNVN